MKGMGQVHTNPVKTQKKKKKAPWEQSNFPPSYSPNDVKTQLHPGPDTAPQSKLTAHVAGASEDHCETYDGTPTSDLVNFDEVYSHIPPSVFNV